MASTNIPVSYALQFDASAYLLMSQEGSKLRNTVTYEPIKGKSAYFDRVGTASAKLVTTKFTKIQYDNPDHSRRQATPKLYRVPQAVDEMDELKVLYDPKKKYVQIAVNAFSKLQDELIYAALVGDAVSTDENYVGTYVPLPAKQIVLKDFGGADTNMSIAKLSEASKILKSKVGQSSAKKYAVMNASAEAALLNLDNVVSMNYSPERSRMSGMVGHLSGFEVIVVPDGIVDGVGTSVSPARCVCYTEHAMKMAVLKDIYTKIAFIDDIDATQILTQANLGGVRMDEARVVVIECVQE